MVFNQLLWSLQSKVILHMRSEELQNLDELSCDERVMTADTKVFINYFKEIDKNYGLLKDFLNFSFGDCDTVIDTVDTFQKGLYLEAFCQGVNWAIVNIDDSLYKIEKSYLAASGSSVIEIHNEFSHIINVLSSLVAAVDKLKEGTYNGCKILDLCRLFVNTELSDVNEVFMTIQLYCLKRFYLQVKCWLVHSELYDPYEEFFIRPSKTAVSAINPEVLDSSLNSSRSSDPVTESKPMKYEVNAMNLPSLIPFSTAVKFLFIGEASIMCQANDKNQLKECVINSDILSELSEIEKYQIFSIKAFSNFIDNLWIKMNNYIRRISDEYGNVSAELVFMWEIYLLGRDELFQEFLLKTSSLLNADVSVVTASNLNIALRDAVCNVYSTENYNLIEQFQFKLPKRRSLLQGMTTWSVMHLDCNIKWPLHFLFTPEVIGIYNKLFSFLLRLKKAQMDLTIACKGLKLLPGHSLRMEFIKIKIHLMSIVSNLQNYCLTYVITNEMGKLLDSAKAATMFTDLQKSLHLFLTNLMNRLFLSDQLKTTEEYGVQETSARQDTLSSKVNRCFVKIFGLCELFSKLTICLASDDITSRLSDLKKELNETLEFLFSFLYSIDFNSNNDHCDSPNILEYLYDLMVYLDYNKFYQDKFKTD